jgi:hypothetical protein
MKGESMKTKQSKGKAYLKGKKLIAKNHYDFKLASLLDDNLLKFSYDSILIDYKEIPLSLSIDFLENAIFLCRKALTEKGKLYIILSRKGTLLQNEIIRENEEFTIYSISK